MKLETFFEKFDQFADAPDAVAKMRELVLAIAVKGTLVPQNRNDEPAEKLIERTRVERELLVQAGRIKRPKTLGENGSVYEETALPSNWVACPLDDIALKITDGEHATPIREIEGHYLLSARNVRDGFIDVADVDYVGQVEFERIRRRCDPDEGDILLSCSGSVGRVAIVDADNKYAMVRSAALIKHSKANVDSGFLALALRSPILQRQIERSSKQSAQANLFIEPIRRLVVPLPPLAEQKRIVAKVDELMALCDRLEAQQQERETRHAALARASLARFANAPTPTNLQFLFHSSFIIHPSDLRKSILTLAVQGKLVPQDPNDEPGEELLKRSLAERRKIKRTESTEVQSLSAEDTLGYDIPESWRWQRLDALLVFGPTNGFSPKAVDYETPVRSLTLSATTSGRFKGQHSKFITTEVPADSDLWLRDGDILVQRGNTIEYVGVAAVYRGEPNCFVYPDLMMKLRVSAAFDVGYVHLAMSHDASRDFLRARASGTSGSMPKINQTTLKSLPLPIPPLAEQRRIVAKVEQLMALVDALETQLAASRATAANLLSALVTELTTPR